mmetsp:Transcript_15553/g.28223  ORF Transcript_15553/g.28223 Transcript_15553/m.28223 type:complete len:296 (-) Transcript_15553:1595-2482(-)
MEVQVLVAFAQFAKFDHFSELESFTIALYLSLFLMVYCFAASIITGNYSQVDQLWSLAPPVYALIFVLHSQTFSVRELMGLPLVLLWGIRLTYNFARKGGYSGVEDYRWEEARKMIPNPVLWQLFNIGFVCFYQILLLMSLVLPLYIASLNSHKPLTPADYAAFSLSFLALLVEVIADQQQWHFQTAKYDKIAKKVPLEGDYARGFLTSGLFHYSRHPNYFAEQAIWWAVYLYSVGATGSWLHWTVIGASQLSLIFHFSTNLTEKMSAAKYPKYADYVRSTSRFVPWFPSAVKID